MFSDNYYEEYFDKLILLKRWARKNYNKVKDSDIQSEGFLLYKVIRKALKITSAVSAKDIKTLGDFIEQKGGIKQLANLSLMERSPHLCLFIYLEYTDIEVEGPYIRMSEDKSSKICHILFPDKLDFDKRSEIIRKLSHERSYRVCHKLGDIDYSLEKIKEATENLRKYILLQISIDLDTDRCNTDLDIDRCDTDLDPIDVSSDSQSRKRKRSAGTTTNGGIQRSIATNKSNGKGKIRRKLLYYADKERLELERDKILFKKAVKKFKARALIYKRGVCLLCIERAKRRARTCCNNTSESFTTWYCNFVRELCKP